MAAKTVAGTAFVILCVLTALSAQAPAAQQQWQPTRTEWGDPDLEGIWRRTHFAWGTLVIDPQDGRLPPLTASAQDRARTAWPSSSQTTGPWTRAADLGPAERCISGGVLGSMLPSFDYHGTEIVQAPGVAVIRSEAIHEARVVPLDARPPLPSDIRGYTGDARGY